MFKFIVCILVLIISLAYGHHYPHRLHRHHHGRRSHHDFEQEHHHDQTSLHENPPILPNNTTGTITNNTTGIASNNTPGIATNNTPGITSNNTTGIASNNSTGIATNNTTELVPITNNTEPAVKPNYPHHHYGRKQHNHVYHKHHHGGSSWDKNNPFQANNRTGIYITNSTQTTVNPEYRHHRHHGSPHHKHVFRKHHHRQGWYEHDPSQSNDGTERSPTNSTQSAVTLDHHHRHHQRVPFHNSKHHHQRLSPCHKDHTVQPNNGTQPVDSPDGYHHHQHHRRGKPHHKIWKHHYKYDPKPVATTTSRDPSPVLNLTTLAPPLNATVPQNQTLQNHVRRKRDTRTPYSPRDNRKYRIDGTIVVSPGSSVDVRSLGNLQYKNTV